MLLSKNRIAQIVIFTCSLGGVFVYGKLPLWIALTAFILPILIIDVLTHRTRLSGLFLIFFVFLIVVSLLNTQTTHISTLFYSLFLCCVFLFSKRKIEQCDPEHLKSIYRNVIYVFFILIIVGLFLHFVLGVNEFSLAKVDISRNIPRSFGPSTEPSYSALTLTIAMWVICSSKNSSSINIRLLLFLYFISIVIIGSGIGFLTAMLLLVYLFTTSNVKVFRIEKAVVLIFLLVGLPFLSFEIDRLKPLFELFCDFLVKGNIWDLSDAIKYADSSAWFRFGPFVEYIRDLQTPKIGGFLLGNGAGTSTAYFGEKYIMHLDPEWFGADGKPHMDLPFFPAFLYDYGAIASLILLYFLGNLMKSTGGFILLLPIALFVLFNSNFNTSIFWFFTYSLLVINVLKRKEYTVAKN